MPRAAGSPGSWTKSDRTGEAPEPSPDQWQWLSDLAGEQLTDEKVRLLLDAVRCQRVIVDPEKLQEIVAALGELPAELRPPAPSSADLFTVRITVTLQAPDISDGHEVLAALTAVEQALQAPSFAAAHPDTLVGLIGEGVTGWPYAFYRRAFRTSSHPAAAAPAASDQHPQARTPPCWRRGWRRGSR